MKIYETLGKELFVFDASELWDEDDECLNEDGCAVRDFVCNHSGQVSFDSMDECGEGQMLRESVKLCLEQKGWTHDIPTSEDWWDNFAKFCHLHYRTDDEAAASTYHYRIWKGDTFEKACDNYDETGIYFDNESSDLEEAGEAAGRLVVSNRDDHPSDFLEDYINWRQIGEDECTLIEYGGGYICVIDSDT